MSTRFDGVNGTGASYLSLSASQPATLACMQFMTSTIFNPTASYLTQSHRGTLIPDLSSLGNLANFAISPACIQSPGDEENDS